MGIFSLFSKKSTKRGGSSKDKSSSGKTRSLSGNTVITGFQDNGPVSNSLIAQRHIARATERKIDAIEFEMSRDIVKTRAHAPATKTGTAAKNQYSTLTAPTQDDLVQQTIPLDRKPLASEFQTTMPMTMPSDYLLGHPTEIPIAAMAYSESVPVLEEAAILFASGQTEVAEQMLQSAVHHQNLGSATEIGWQMLFDLYRVTHNQYQFESLSLDYANKFETSPPLWPEDAQKPVAEESGPASTPSILFPAKLDASIVKTLEKLQTLSQKSRTLKLDFSRVQAVDPIGCGLLLRTLKHLKKSGHDLMLVGAQSLADKIRAILQVGRRDETEAPWLLLLEVLQLLHFERAFEEASMDYCITFEVSPPSFEPPKNKVTNAFPEIIEPQDDEPGPEFLMPEVVEGKIDHLLSRITDQSRHYNPLVLNCTKLQKVEFSASAELLNGLAPIAGEPGMSIQFIEVNYLVMMLFNAMGLKNIASISVRKQ